MTDDVRNLLGGYATGTLTEDEKKILFDAALTDDAVFAALADEQALKEMLDDSGVRAQVLQATEEPRFSVIGALREWFERPKSQALVAIGAVLLAIIGINEMRRPQRPEMSQVAEVRRPLTSVGAPPAESPQQQPQPEPAATKPPSRRPALSDRPAPAAEAQSEAKNKLAREADQPYAAAAPPPPPAPASPAPVIAAEVEAGAVANNPTRTGRIVGGLGAFARSSTRPAASAPAATADANGPVGAGVFQQAAGTSVTPLRYELLLRDAAGRFQPVPPDYFFNPGDVVRLRVTSTRDGALGVSSNTGDPTISRMISANVWSEAPQDGGIVIGEDMARLTVFFAPADVPSSALLKANEVRAKRAPAPSVSLEIPIRLKKP